LLAQRIAGVDPATGDATAFGVAFRASAGAAAAGTVKVNAATNPLTPPAVNGQFHYFGLAG
jgi:hypothetical protein